MLSIIHLIKEIEKRPGMYLGKCQINYLKVFLDGYIFCSSDSNTTIQDLTLYRNFQDWVAKKYNEVESYSWAEIILFNSKDECDALINFFKDFQSFLDTYNHSLRD